jgi:hypothetical protein
MNATPSLLGKALAYARAHGVRFGLEMAANFVLPFAVYSYGADRFGAVPALMAASGPPILWSVFGFVRERKLDAISVLVLAGITLSLLAFAGGGGVKVLQLRENLMAGLVGLVFLGSAAIGRPLIFHLACAGARRRAKEAGLAVEGLRDDAGFRRAMVVATLAWGFGLLAACAANCVLVFALSIKQFLLVSGPVSWLTLGLLTAWTFWYVPRAVRQATARPAPNRE